MLRCRTALSSARRRWLTAGVVCAVFLATAALSSVGQSSGREPQALRVGVPPGIARYKNLGINAVVGLDHGTTTRMLDAIHRAGMYVVGDPVGPDVDRGLVLAAPTFTDEPDGIYVCGQDLPNWLTSMCPGVVGSHTHALAVAAMKSGAQPVLQGGRATRYVNHNVYEQNSLQPPTQRLLIKPAYARTAAALKQVNLMTKYHSGRLYVFAAVDHEPWPLRTRSLLDVDQHLLQAAGLPAPEEPPRVRCSGGVAVRIGWPRSRPRPHRSGRARR